MQRSESGTGSRSAVIRSCFCSVINIFISRQSSRSRGVFALLSPLSVSVEAEGSQMVVLGNCSASALICLSADAQAFALIVLDYCVWPEGCSPAPKGQRHEWHLGSDRRPRFTDLHVLLQSET